VTSRATLLGLSLLAAWPVLGLDEEFRKPPNQYGPSAFWWWFVGAPYSDQDVERAIDSMREAGLGGFRITPVYSFPGGPAGGPAYLSDGYLRLASKAVDYGRRNGLVPDALLGTGWPFGGPHIPPEMGAGEMRFARAQVDGPAVFTGQAPGSLTAGESVVAVQAARLSLDGGIDLATVIDLTKRTAGLRVSRWDVPAGRWVLMSFIAGKTGMKVKRAAPGGEGLVLDHFRREALDLHLRHNASLQAPYLKGVESVTMDSLEVFGSNWTPTLPEEFARRRGYRLEPYLAALFTHVGEDGPAVRHDFRATISELALENFFRPLRDWAHQNGFRTRVEAHGTPADIIEAYGLNDVPEAETYGPQNPPSIQIRNRRLASSAAHLFGQRQISCETFTWLRYPLFSESLQQMKAAADASYLDGVNQVNYHGVPFSPSSATAPGFFFYASTFVSPGNTWWPYLSFLSDYLRRSNYMLQQGEPVADVAVYLPIEDTWSEAMGNWYDLAGAIERRFQGLQAHAMLESLQRAGLQFDFINAKRIELGAVDRYRAVILPWIESIEPAVLSRLIEFQKRGGLVVAAGAPPSRSPGLVNRSSRDDEVRALARRLFQPGLDTVIPDYAALPLDPHNHPVARWLQSRIAPDLVSGQLGKVGFVHRRTNSEDIYFLANHSGSPLRFEGGFRTQRSRVAAFDPETGHTRPLYEAAPKQGGVALSLPLDAGRSVFIVFREGDAPRAAAHNVDRVTALGPASAAAEVRANGPFFVRTASAVFNANVDDLPADLNLPGPWTLSVPNAKPRTILSPADWTDLPDLASFSGTASYTSAFTLPSSWIRPDQRLVVEMESVHEIAEVILNGRKEGVAWRYPFNVDIQGAVPGRNVIDIRVTNLLFNRMLGAPGLPAPYVPLRQVRANPLPSGLHGLVRIKAIRRIELKP